MNKIKETSTEVLILNTAKKVFFKKGMWGTRMQEIADEAGINKALLHYYFRSKELLFKAVFNEAFKTIAPQLNEILNADDSLFEKIKNFSNTYITLIQEHPYLPGFLINEINRNENFIEDMQAKNVFPPFEKFKLQVEEDIRLKKIKPINFEQLFINIISLNIFPFLGKPLLKNLLNFQENEFNEVLEKRKTEVANFIINAIKY